MSERGYLSKPNYLWIWDMEWRTIDEIFQYEYYEDEDMTENKTIIPFAFTGGGDDWLWVPNGENQEYCVGLYWAGEATYFAKNTEDAIFREIIEYVSSSDFYIDEVQAQSWQISENELMQLLEKYERCFQGILNEEYLNVISQFRKQKLKPVKHKCGEWNALLDEAEHDALIKKYINFDLLDQEFPWWIEK
ncbi:MAG: hypothetical protein K2O32_11690 [Acetatifactor sp.]|nr:hypothetical protein [Acetatifactor sp.]